MRLVQGIFCWLNNPMSDRPIKLAKVADMIGRSLPWIYRNIRTLQADHGFPKPLPVIRLYDPLAIEQWVAKQRGEVSPAAAVSGQPPIDWAAVLDERAAGLAG